ncbi:hypothetical protein [Arenimonas sp.]|uniref:hypothetical protein n=1 Tax=Arenimonas sp. TaxID=1872635 RepID=UPI002E345D1A|nr:hypothetical protein [Arenimonas sp.]HEX4854964.1 hypothetical protein [Arenimonas sp.]
MSIARLAAAGLLLSAGLALPGATGARPGAGEDRAETIPAAIHEIQGDGLVSPLAGIEVMVEGIVTARTLDGYFIQTPDDATDGLPETSEGLFVEMQGLERVGDRVVVYGRVEEVKPYDYPHQLTVTRLVDISSQFVIASGEPLPAPLLIDPASLAPDAGLDALEPLEGMRVHAAELVVVGATRSHVSPATQVVFGNGIFHAMAGLSVAPDALPFREPGLHPLEGATAPAGKSLPANDGNPQVLRVEGNGQRGSIHATLEVGLNDRVRDAVGVLDYAGARYALLLDAQSPLAVESGYRGEGAFFLAPGEVKLVWMDLGGLYDASDDPLRDEPVHAPAVYQARLAKIANGLCTFLANPEVIAVGGVENVQVLEDLAALVETNPTTYCPEPRQYEAVLVEGSDASGLDLGFLVAGYVVDGLSPRVQVLEAGTFAEADTNVNPDGSSEPLFVRPPLAARLRLTDAGGRQAEFTAVNVKIADDYDASSLTPGGAGWATTGDRVMARRARQAARVAAWVEARQQADANEAIAMLGGFEADPFNDGRVDVMGILTGRPAPAAETWLAMPSPLTTPLDNLTELAPAHTRYNANDSGEFRALDHILVNAPMRRRFAITSAHPRMNADFPASARAAGDPGFTFSARDPLMARLAVAAFIDADTRVEIYSQGTFSPRVDNIFYVGVTNQGPDPAPSLELVIESSLAPGQWSLSTEWPGWTCGAVEAAASGSRVACNNPRMIESHGFQIHVPADLSLDGRNATFTATLRGGHNDPDLSDNTSTRVFAFDGRADLNVRLTSTSGPDDLIPGDSGGWIVYVDRGPLNPPGPVTITMDVDAVASDVTLNLLNGGVTCDTGVAITPGRSRFTCTAVNDDFLQVAAIGLTFRTRLLDGGRVVGLRAEARAGGTDPTPADNVATASRRVSDRTDLVVSAPSVSPELANLASQPFLYFSVRNALRGVARNARLEILVDLPPAAIGEVDTLAFGQTPDIWACQPPVANGAGSRIACTTTSPLLQPEFPSYTYGFQLRFTPPYRAGLENYTVTTRVLASSDSEEQVPADNGGEASFTVDQTTDLAIYAASGSVVTEPGLATFLLLVENYGPNSPRNPRVRLVLDAVLAPGDIVFSDSVGRAITCSADAAPAGSTAVACPVRLDHPVMTVTARTSPAIAVRGTLALQATATHDLPEAKPANNLATGSVNVLAQADLCLGRNCGSSARPYPVRLEPTQVNSLAFDLANLGPSTAREAVVIVEATVPPAQLGGGFDSQACAPAEAVGGGLSRMYCGLGDRIGDRVVRPLSVDIDSTGLSGDVTLRLRLQSRVLDPQLSNNALLFTLPVVPVVDLSAQVAAKRTRFPAAAVFSITAAADGPPTGANSELLIRIESPGAAGYANLVTDGIGWLCSPTIFDTEVQEWTCARFLPIATGAPSFIGVEVPASQFSQIGRPIRVSATHRYPPSALAVDRTPGNNTATATHVVDGRRTQSAKGAPKPTPAYGVRRVPAPAATRAPASRAATR